MAQILFSSAASSGLYTITVTLTWLTDNTVELKAVGTQQHVVYATYFTAQSCTPEIAEIGSSGEFRKNLGPYNSNHLYRQFYYIYAVKDARFAKIVQKIIPTVYYASKELLCKGDVFLYRVPDLWLIKIGNYGNTVKYTSINGTVYTIDPDEVIDINTSIALYDINIRDSKAPSGSYMSLTAEEREEYVPASVAEGYSTSIRYNSTHEWVRIDTCLYHGSLTYVSSTDKDLRMRDDKGREYKYNIEAIRDMIPYLVHGVVSGTFKYSPRGARNINYVLVLHKAEAKRSDLALCDSDSSDGDDVGAWP